jgi:uncharacterized repeat protein (TIGR03833 family)
MILPNKKSIHEGLLVEIKNKNKDFEKGIVKEIFANSSSSNYGIRVKLENDSIGRVQRIISKEKNKETKILSEEDKIKNIIKEGETSTVEFKSSILWSQDYSLEQIKQSKSQELMEFGRSASKVIIAKEIAAFLNSKGGSLFIGIKERKEDKGEFEIIGIQEELKKIRDSSIDGYKRLIMDEIIRKYFPPKIYNHLEEYFNISFLNINSKILCLIKVNRSNSRVFIEINNKKIFMIRIESEIRTLAGEELVDYCDKHFRKG